MTRHEAFEQGSVHAVQVAVASATLKTGFRFMCRAAWPSGARSTRAVLSMRRLQSQRQIDGDGGRAVAALGIHDRENFSADAFLTALALRGAKPDKSLQHIRGRSGPLNEFAGSRPASR